MGCASIIRARASLATAEFDGIADVYDETRRALDSETLLGMEEMLRKHGCRRMLEVAIGTGRVSVPLIKAGFDVAGIDISRRMMERARAKGAPNLILADGRRAPFRGGSFDGVMMAHVIHLLEDPLAVMREAARVAEVGVFALLRKSPQSRPWFPFFWGAGPSSVDPATLDDATRRYLEERRERFRKIAAKYDRQWDPSRRFRNWRREREIVESMPPDDIRQVSDYVNTETVEERIARMRKGGYEFMSDMPVAMKEEVIDEMLASASSLPEWARQPHHEVYLFAMWRPETILRHVPDAEPSPL